jgi:acetyltransferase
VETVTLRTGRTVLLRPVLPEDESAYHDFFLHLEPEDVHSRFFGAVRVATSSELARYTRIDYDREMAFVATPWGVSGNPEALGEVRAVVDPENNSAEFGLVVRSDVKGQGLGRSLFSRLIWYHRGRGTKELIGQVLPHNVPMLRLAASLGFTRHLVPEDGVVEVHLVL